MSKTIRPVKGTRDFYPDEMAVRNWIYGNVHNVSEAHGYQEYEGPFLEYVELYAAKSGDELVKEQSFVFSDRGGDLVSLRPELTPTLARMVAQRQNQLFFPLRWWSWGPFWRYERPQKGRSREFFQWNIDLIGVESPAADAEIISIIASLFRMLGLQTEQVKIFVNNRQLMETELSKLNISPDRFSEIFRLIDRRDKMSEEKWDDYSCDLGLSGNQVDGLKSILSNDSLWNNSDYLIQLFEIVDALGFSEYVSFAPYIIRGLDYYTSTVFEAWEKNKDFRAILGGGRYDNLVADVGGSTLPAVGFAMGDMIIRLVLEKYNLLPPNVFKPPASVLVTVFDSDTISESYKFASDLRNQGLSVACYPTVTKLGKQFKYGDRMKIKLAIIIGPDELAKNTISIKDLRTGEQYSTPRIESYQFINKLLDNHLAS